MICNHKEKCLSPAACIRAGYCVSVSLTGRTPSEPNMQFNRPKLHPYQQEAVTAIKEGLGAHRRAVYGIDMADAESRTVLALVGGDGVREMICLEDLKAYSGKRKADRDKVARALIMLAQGHGAQSERQDDRDCVTLRISLAGVGALIDVDATLGAETSMISWHNTEHPARDFTTRFCGIVGGAKFARPHHKASSLPGDWYSLAMFLDAGLLLAARSEAFVP